VALYRLPARGATRNAGKLHILHIRRRGRLGFASAAQPSLARASKNSAGPKPNRPLHLQERRKGCRSYRRIRGARRATLLATGHVVVGAPQRVLAAREALPHAEALDLGDRRAQHTLTAISQAVPGHGPAAAPSQEAVDCPARDGESRGGRSWEEVAVDRRCQGGRSGAVALAPATRGWRAAGPLSLPPARCDVPRRADVAAPTATPTAAP
jgi:hypothetical protein